MVMLEEHTDWDGCWRDFTGLFFKFPEYLLYSNSCLFNTTAACWGLFPGLTHARTELHHSPTSLGDIIINIILIKAAL